MSTNLLDDVLQRAREVEQAEVAYFEARMRLNNALCAAGHLRPEENSPSHYACVSWRERDGHVEARGEGDAVHRPTGLRLTARAPHLGLAVARSAESFYLHAAGMVREQVFLFALTAEEVPGHG